MLTSGRISPRMVIAALLLGALTTIAISWVAMFVPHGREFYGPPADHELGVVRDDSGEYMRYFQLWEGSNEWHHVVTYWWMQISGQSMWLHEDDYHDAKFDLESLPDHLRPDSLGEIVMQSWYREVGWPMKALTCAVHWEEQIRNEDIIYRVEGGIQLPRDKNYEPRALPLVPLWPGFAVNTLLYALFWVMCFSAVRFARTTWRRKKSRCVHCGYPRTGLPAGARCPECGHAQ